MAKAVAKTEAPATDSEKREPMYSIASMSAKDVGQALQRIWRPFIIHTRLGDVRELHLVIYDADGIVVSTQAVTTQNLSEITQGKVSNPDLLKEIGKTHNLDVAGTR